MSTTPSTTTEPLTSVEVARLMVEIVEQLIAAKVVVVATDMWFPYLVTNDPHIRLFLDSQANVDQAATMFDLAPVPDGTQYEATGAVRGVRFEVWSGREKAATS